MRITEPTDIQELAIASILRREDVIFASHTGSGKTLAYLLPLIEMLRSDERRPDFPAVSRPNRPRALIVVPTRELSYQVHRVAKGLSHHARCRVACFTTGPGKSKLSRKLKAPIDLIIGTPGLLNKYKNEGKLMFSEVEYVVVDEADTLYGTSRRRLQDSEDTDSHRSYGSRGRTRTEFEEDMNELFLPLMRRRASGGSAKPCQFILASASLPGHIMERLHSYFPQAKRVHTGSLHRVPPTLKQTFVPVGGNDKLELLEKILLRTLRDPDSQQTQENVGGTAAMAPITESTLTSVRQTEISSALFAMSLGSDVDGAVTEGGGPVTRRVPQTLVFTNTIASCRATAHYLASKGFSLASYHAQIPQQKRAEYFSLFIRGDRDILVCTDIAARGLDTSNVSHVIMFDFPKNAIDYLHRAGRTARAGSFGQVTGLITKRDIPLALAMKRTASLDSATPLTRSIRNNPFKNKKVVAPKPGKRKKALSSKQKMTVASDEKWKQRYVQGVEAKRLARQLADRTKRKISNRTHRRK